MAHREDGGRTVVVLSGRDKLAMEAAFARTLPMKLRFGSRLVFRQVRESHHCLRLIKTALLPAREPRVTEFWQMRLMRRLGTVRVVG